MKTQRYPDDAVREMIATGLWLHYAAQLRSAANQRGLSVTSVTPIAEVVVKLQQVLCEGGRHGR